MSKILELKKILLEKTEINHDDADTLSHALIDVQESLEKIYNTILPKFYEENDRVKIIELIWEIKDEFNHINYHIEDANLTELNYIKEKI